MLLFLLSLKFLVLRPVNIELSPSSEAPPQFKVKSPRKIIFVFHPLVSLGIQTVLVSPHPKFGQSSVFSDLKNRRVPCLSCSKKTFLFTLDVKQRKVEYYNNDQNFPIYSRDTIELKKIFSICLAGSTPDEVICKNCPLRVKENANFIIHQEKCNIKHPFDLQADNIGGAFLKKDQVRFYEAEKDVNSEIKLSSEVHVEKMDGKVIGGQINSLFNGSWESRDADIRKMYALVRKRAEHKKSKEAGKSLVRYIIFLMNIEEYNLHYGNMSKLQRFQLDNPHILLSYQTSEDDDVVEIIEKPHGNVKLKKGAPAFRPITHSSRKALEKAVATSSSVAPRHFLSTIEKKNSIVFEESNETPNIRHIYNYRQRSINEQSDPYLELMRELLATEENDPNYYFNVLDETQPFVREV